MARARRLLELCEADAPARRRSRWAAIAVIAAVTAVVSVLFFMRVPATHIELVATASSVSFRSSIPQKLSDPVELVELGAIGVASVQRPGQPERARAASDDADLAVRLSRASEQGPAGSMTLGELFIEDTTAVEVRSLGREGALRLSIDGRPGEVRINLDGAFDMTIAGLGTERLSTERPSPMILSGAREPLGLELTATEASLLLGRDLAVDALSFDDVEHHVDGTRMVVARRSTLLSGVVYMESLSGQELVLRRGQRLSFTGAEGALREVAVAEGHVVVGFHGRVRGMATGFGETRRSLMPTYLEWLAARHGLALLWATVLSSVGFLFGALRWWGLRI